jgi:ABC-type bacteriocin/lantibiotic exporter with double-glycine peptidase domain
MLLAYFDTHTSEKELAKACGTTELGTTPTQITDGASEFGLNLIATKNAEIEDIKKQLKDKNPVIAMIDPSHIYGGVEGIWSLCSYCRNARE